MGGEAGLCAPRCAELEVRPVRGRHVGVKEIHGENDNFVHFS